MPHPPRDESEEFYEALRALWQESKELEEPSPKAIARARAIYRPPRRRAWLRHAGEWAAVALLVLGVLAWLTVQAAQASVPGDSLYPVKRAVERVQLATVFNNGRAVELYLALSQRRLEEIQVLLERGSTGAEGDLLQQYQEQMDRARASLDELAATDPQQAAALEPQVRTLAQQHLEELEVIRNLSSEHLEPEISEAQNASLEVLNQASEPQVLIVATPTAANHSPPTAPPTQLTAPSPAQALPSRAHTAPADNTSEPTDIPAATEQEQTYTPIPSATEEPPATDSPAPTRAVPPSHTPEPSPTPEPTRTPEPTVTVAPTNTPKQTSTRTPTATAQPTDTPAPSSTLTPSGTPTAEPTDTPVPSDTPEPTRTPRPSHTPKPTHTPEPTRTPKPSETPELTRTPEPSNTPEPSPTLEPSETPRPSLTPKPETFYSTGSLP